VMVLSPQVVHDWFYIDGFFCQKTFNCREAAIGYTEPYLGPSEKQSQRLETDWITGLYPTVADPLSEGGKVRRKSLGFGKALPP